MMDKELCFCIEGNKLYLEQVLVDYNEIPIFFLCKDAMAYYAVLCSDVEELSYIAVRLLDADVYMLLHGMLSMREVFTRQGSYWQIKSGENIDSDMVIRKKMREIDYSVLPEEGAYFEILTDGVSSYAEKFDAVFLEKEQFQESSRKVNFDENILNGIYEDDLRLEGKFDKVLYEGQLGKKITMVSQGGTINYGENMPDIWKKPCMTKPEKDYSEEWESVELRILAYAA